MNDPQLTNVLISIIGSLVVAALGWMMAVQRGYRRYQASLRSEMRTEFAAANTRADARAGELSRRIDDNGRRIDHNGRRIDDNGRRIDQLVSWVAALLERLTGLEFRMNRLEFRVDPHARPPSLEELPSMNPPPAEEGPTRDSRR